MKFKRTILGETWTIKVLKKFPKGSGADDVGLTFPQLKIIVLKQQELSLTTIIHELNHAYFSYQALDSTTAITGDDREEIMCEFNSRYSARILNDAISILLQILDKAKIPIADVDRTLIGDLYILHETLDIVGERLGFQEARGEEV